MTTRYDHSKKNRSKGRQLYTWQRRSASLVPQIIPPSLPLGLGSTVAAAGVRVHVVGLLSSQAEKTREQRPVYIWRGLWDRSCQYIAICEYTRTQLASPLSEPPRQIGSRFAAAAVRFLLQKCGACCPHGRASHAHARVWGPRATEFGAGVGACQGARGACCTRWGGDED
jgi:hypothetical protein